MLNYFSALGLLIDYASLSLRNRFFLSNFIDCYGVKSCQNFRSNMNLPSFNNSAMDGYALRVGNSQFLSKGEQFKVVGRINAGDRFDNNFNFKENHSFEIMTGAYLPLFFNSVVKLEDICLKNGNIVLNKDVKIWENVKKIGEDYSINDLLVRNGDSIVFSKIMSLSAVGESNIAVLKKPKIYLVTTGNEIKTFALTNNSFFIYDSISNFVMIFLKNYGLDVIYLGVTSDSIYSVYDLLKDVLKSDELSIVITTGAVSKGKADFLPDYLKSINSNIIFHGVNIKPGKPILFSLLTKSVYFFCLPGNPIASVVGMRFFVYPFIRAIMGFNLEKPVRAKLVNKILFCNNFSLFLKSFLFRKNNFFYVKILNEQESFKVSGLINSNSFSYLNCEKKKYFKNDLIDVYKFDFGGCYSD